MSDYDTTTAYLAGFFDGEGAISVTRLNLRPGPRVGAGGRVVFQLNISAAQIDRTPLDIFRQRYGGTISLNRRASRNHPIYQWQCTSRKAMRALREMLPYLVVKAGQAHVAILFQTHRSSRQHDGKWLSPIDIAERESFYEAMQKRPLYKPVCIAEVT